jgi:hypothetical protein
MRASQVSKRKIVPSSGRTLRVCQTRHSFVQHMWHAHVTRADARETPLPLPSDTLVHSNIATTEWPLLLCSYGLRLSHFPVYDAPARTTANVGSPGLTSSLKKLPPAVPDVQAGSVNAGTEHEPAGAQKRVALPPGQALDAVVAVLHLSRPDTLNRLAVRSTGGFA